MRGNEVSSRSDYLIQSVSKILLDRFDEAGFLMEDDYGLHREQTELLVTFRKQGYDIYQELIDIENQNQYDIRIARALIEYAETHISSR